MAKASAKKIEAKIKYLKEKYPECRFPSRFLVQIDGKDEWYDAIIWSNGVRLIIEVACDLYYRDPITAAPKYKYTKIPCNRISASAIMIDYDRVLLGVYD